MANRTGPRVRRVTGRGLLNAAVDLTAAGLIVVVALRLYSIATAVSLPFDPYIYRADGSRADPVNLVFESPAIGVSSDDAVAAVTSVLGWYEVTGEQMAFRDAGTSRPVGRHLGLDLGGGARLHMRIARVEAGDTSIRVLAAVHRDEPATCGHVGRAFDEVRDQVARAFRDAGYLVTELSPGNNASGQHCDGSRTPGDGRAIVIRLPAPVSGPKE